MDKNAITGLLLIGAILLGWQLWMSPNEQELEAQKAAQDSIALVQQQISEEEQSKAIQNKQAELKLADSIMSMPDSAKQAYLAEEYGSMAPSMVGNTTIYEIENEYIHAEINSKGGYIQKLELKDYKTYDSLPVEVINGDSTKFNLKINAGDNTYNTSDLYFDVVKSTASSIVLQAKSLNSNEYVQVTYNLEPESHFVDYGFQSTLKNTANLVVLDWKEAALTKEKSYTQEKSKSTGYYKYFDENPDYLSERSSDDVELEKKTQWVSFKQQFFAVSLISNDGFNAGSKYAITSPDSKHGPYTKSVEASLNTPLNNGSTNLRIYAGPLKFNLVKTFDLGLEKQIDLGWGFFRWISRFLIIPVFDLLDGWGMHYGLIILIMTVLIKLLLSPITYKTYLSSAKMKALKPEIEEINEKYKGKEGSDMQKQQDIMALYSKTGVNPLAGCVPMLIQFPFLIAMFRFFPASIELRGQSFLWADDLSSYDTLFQLPFEIPFYGDHVSGFTLAMAISTFFYTKNNNSQMAMGSTNGMQAQQMKIMTYMMPLMLLVFFNSYSAGLSLYYFTANIITITQQWAVKKFIINEDKIHQQIQDNKNKPKKKGKFQQRLEQMQQMQEQQNRQTRRKK